MDQDQLMGFLLAGGGLGAVFTIIRWYLKERMQQSLDERNRQFELQQRREELQMKRLEHEQEVMKEIFARFGDLSDRMSTLIFELALPKPTKRSHEEPEHE